MLIHKTVIAAAGRGTRLLPAATARRKGMLSRALLLCAGRPARFTLTGGLAGLVQLGLLTVFTRWGWAPDLANAAAFLAAAQINFLLSSTFTWRDRLAGHAGGGTPWRRWLAFHGAIAGMALVNLLVYSAARHVVPLLGASALGIAAAAAGNFLLGDRLVFRQRGPAISTTSPRHAPHRRTKEVAA